MQHGHIGGKFCKRCIGKYFGQYTLWTAVVGWWGLVSCIVTPFVLIWNTGLFLTTLGLQGPDPNAGPPQLTQEAMDKLTPYTERLLHLLNVGKPLGEAAKEIAPLAGVSPMQVVLYLQAVVSVQREADESGPTDQR